MVYVRINRECSRLGNWMLSYASAVSQRPDEPVTFVVQGESTKGGGPERYAEMWPTARFEVCTCTDCAMCGKCACVSWDCSTFDVYAVRRSLQCPERVKRAIFHRFGDELNDAVSIGVRRGDYLRLPHTHPFVGQTSTTATTNPPERQSTPPPSKVPATTTSPIDSRKTQQRQRKREKENNNVSLCRTISDGAKDISQNDVFAECGSCSRKVGACWRTFTSRPSVGIISSGIPLFIGGART